MTLFSRHNLFAMPIAIVSFVAAATPSQPSRPPHLPVLPKAVASAFKQAHREARLSKIRNLFMFNYAYYAGGYCRDQDCSSVKVADEMAAARAKMGDDFSKYNQHFAAYASAIETLQKELPKGDLATLSGLRSSEQIERTGIYITCVDFTKRALELAIQNGYPKSKLRFYIAMAEAPYLKMCPKPDGSKPIPPRPTVHTMIAYERGGEWLLLNVEDPEAVSVPLGSLPIRLQRKHQVTFPALVAYQSLIFAGAFEPDAFVNGYDFSWLLSITASGTLESDPTKVVCQ